MGNYHLVWMGETDVFLMRGEEFCTDAAIPSPEEQAAKFQYWTGDTSEIWLRHDPGRLVHVNRTLTMWGKEGLEAACRDPTSARKTLYTDALPTIFNPPEDAEGKRWAAEIGR